MRLRGKGQIRSLVIVLAAAWLVVPAQAADDPLASWNDGPAKQAILAFVSATTDQASPQLRAARGSDRHLRSGRHAVGVASALHAGDVRARPGARTGAEASGMEEEGAVQGGSRRRSRGDGEIRRGGLGADHRRHPRRDEHRGFPRDRQAVAGDGQASALPAAVHRPRLPADAGGDGLPAGQRLQDLHRHRRRPGVRARLQRAGLRRSAGAGGRIEHRHQVRSPRTASRC